MSTRAVTDLMRALGLALAAAGWAALRGQGAASLDDGLVAHWTFDEGSGDVARDVTGNGHDAVLKAVEWVPSPRGHALRFDSRGDLARYAGVETMILSGDMTLAVWVRTDAAAGAGTNRLIFGDTGLGVERNLNLRLDGYGNLRFEWADGKVNASLLAPASLLNGTWKHVVVSADSGAGVAVLYVDGAEAARTEMPLPISPAPVRERLTGWFYNGFFQGDLDDIRLYRRALSAAEAGALFAAQADLQIGAPVLRFDVSRPEPWCVSSVLVRNAGREVRLVEAAVPGLPARLLRLEPGAAADLVLGGFGLKPIRPGRADLFLADPPAEAESATVTIRRGDAVETVRLGRPPQAVVEPIAVRLQDPWQRDLADGPTQRLEGDLSLAILAEQLPETTLRVSLVAPATGHEALRHELRGPGASVPLALDVSGLPWGAYRLEVSLLDRGGREVARTARPAAVLPGGSQRLRVLNNLATELMDARARGLLGQPRIEFMNPREGWVWFQAAGACSVRLGDELLLTVAAEAPAGEAMRLLPAGRQVLQVTGAPSELVVRAVPALVYNVYPSSPRIAPFGPHTWERLRRHTLPNTNMIESQVVGTPEHREWLAQGRLWIGNVQAPGLIDKKEWTVESMLEVWLKPGTSTAHPERPGFDLAALSGLQVDEYYGAIGAPKLLATALSIARLADRPEFAGKLWIPFVVDMFGNPVAELFMKTVLGAGWPYSVEVYVGEMRTEAEDRRSIEARFRAVAAGWESAYPGSVRRTIFTPMYSCLPYCTTNRSPQADFRVHLDLQMEMLANEPAFFGLWGVQPYRSNYVDPETLDCMGRLLRHYCIEGRTERLLQDPYELRHVADPDFEEGLARWQAAPAEGGTITAGTFAGYGQLQGRYPPGPYGDTFAVLTRSDRAPNRLSQTLHGLQAGRLYSLKLITADWGDLQAGRSRRDEQALAIVLEGAEVLPGAFRHPFVSARGPAPFTQEKPFWMTYHWLRFRASGPEATLTLSDWAGPADPGGPAGQQVMVSFVEVQPVLADD